MNFITNIDDIQVLVEAPTSGAFAKSELEIQPDPLRALQQAIELTAVIGRKIGREIGPALARTGCVGDVQFGISIDQVGQVMVASTPANAQIVCTVRYVPRRSTPS